jgi:hypothetical protein
MVFKPFRPPLIRESIPSAGSVKATNDDDVTNSRPAKRPRLSEEEENVSTCDKDKTAPAAESNHIKSVLKKLQPVSRKPLVRVRNVLGGSHHSVNDSRNTASIAGPDSSQDTEAYYNVLWSA